MAADLSPVERRLVDAIVAGEQFDGTVSAAPVDDTDARDQTSAVRAEVVQDLCLGRQSDVSRARLRISNVTIAGDVVLSGEHLDVQLLLQNCQVNGSVILTTSRLHRLGITGCHVSTIDLTAADLGSVDLSGTTAEQVLADGIVVGGRLQLQYALIDGGCSIRAAHICGSLQCSGSRISGERHALSGDGLIVDGGAYFRDTSFRGEVSLRDARLGSLNLDRASIDSDGGEFALSADRFSTAGSADLRGIVVHGTVSLIGGNVGGELVLNNTRIDADRGFAVLADRIKVGSGLYLRNAQIEGETRALGAAIQGHFSCSNATFSKPGGHALHADRIEISDQWGLRNAVVHGALLAGGARIDGPVVLNGTTLENPGGVALALTGSRLADRLEFLPKGTPNGSVNLEDASVRSLDDSLAAWPDELRLDRFEYGALVSEDSDPKQRCEWLSRSRPFSRRPYDQLRAVYLKEGRDRDARTVAVRAERAVSDAGGLGRTHRLWRDFLRVTVGYGYLPTRAGLWLLAIFVAASALFLLPPAHDAMAPTSGGSAVPVAASASCDEPYPCFHAQVYILDLLLPVVDLDQADHWVAVGTRSWSDWYRALGWILVLAGWIITTALLAGIAAVWRSP